MWWLKVSGRPSTYCNFRFVETWWLMVTDLLQFSVCEGVVVNGYC